MKNSFFIKSASAAFLLAIAAIPAAFAQVPNQPDSVRFNPKDTFANPQFPTSLDDSQIVAPTAPNWVIPENPVRKFDKFILPPPPSNTSVQTADELRELNQLAATRNNPNVIKTITRWNFDPPASNYNYYFDHLVQLYKYSPPLAARCSAMLNEGIYAGLLAAWYNKFTYLRPRPDQVTNYTFKAANPIMPTPYHPAYPSGHSTSAGVFIAVGAACFPEEPVENFVALGREASLSRRQGGVHYYSDSVAGEALGYTIGSAVVRGYRDDASPLGGNTAASVYSRPPSFNSNGTPTTTLVQKKATITVGPQLSSDPGNPGKQRIILAPIKPNGQFSNAPVVQNPPNSLFIIPATSTTQLGPVAPTTVNPTGRENNAPATFSDPNPVPGLFIINNSGPIVPLNQIDSAPSSK
ncbi:vanadium-dependent haloperoxidase [Nostoc sphaeroides CHAB 2801]|uniref:vanadium-dependent haloperoxidase n=1 Tax=Nostoc sphaeroides TaxID=446679 RepID=UPI000E493AA7|nr:vanadium-dependent haloperoxidase [Nostoc sphaeroides]MCC5628264.1 vanadium-dependent haloperoxidase [Nostoc sphaeroides CHAB 2801]